jgi:thiamine pyrophosphokinase
MAKLVIFANGIVPNLEAVRHLIEPDDVIYAADGGTRHALALGLLPALVIGDLDSLMPSDRQILEQRDVELELFPRNKDKTDLELALEAALQTGKREILLVGALGGRLDQTLGNLSLLSDQSLAEVDICLDDGLEQAFFIRTEGEIHGRPGDIVSLIPWGAQVTAITTNGLQWPLRSETLFPAETRGISNVLQAETASVRIGSGLLLIIHRHSA